MKRCKLKRILLLTCLLTTSCSKSTWHNNVGFFKLYRGNPSEAKIKFTDALLENPGNALARYNLAMSNLHLEQLKDSLKELEALEKTYENRDELRQSNQLFQVYFAKAFLLESIQNTPQALEYYQKALGIYPDSIKVKNNIEILTAKGSKGKNSKKKGNKGKSKGSEKNKSQNEDSEKDKKEIKGQDDKSLQKKNLSDEEIEQILKEIKEQESKVRAKENKKNDDKKSSGGNEKTW